MTADVREDFLHYATAEAMGTLQGDPEWLLRRPGGVPPVGADAYIAVLFGDDEQILHRWWLTGRPGDVLRLPIMPKLRPFEPEPQLYPITASRDFQCMNGYARMAIPLHVAFDLGFDWDATVLVLFYEPRR